MTTTNPDLVELLEQEAARLSGRSIESGCVDSGISANLALEAAARIEELEGERDANGREAFTLRNERDAARTNAAKWLDLHETAEARIEELEQALRPFATVGRIVDGPFGPALFAEDEMAFKSGCAWTENGEKKTLTWGDFRRARSALGAS